MAKIRNISGEARVVPSLGDRLVLPNQVVEVLDDDAYGFTQQTTVWAAADTATEELSESAEAEYQERLEESLRPPQPPEEVVLHQPAGNASREEWVAYVTAAGLATADDLGDMGRDAIRGTYGNDDIDGSI